MNRYAKSICIVSKEAIDASLVAHEGEQETSIFTNLTLFGGLFYVGLAGSAQTDKQLGDLWRSHASRVQAIMEVLFDQQETLLEIARQHIVKALSLTQELMDELAFLVASPDEVEQRHYAAVEWGVSMVSVGILLAASTNLLEPETVAPQSVASMLAYICHYALTKISPDSDLVEEFAGDPPVLKVAGIISRALRSSEFELAVTAVKQALVPAQEYLTPLGA